MDSTTVKTQLIAATRSVLGDTGIVFTGSAGMTWDSCSDHDMPPFQGTVTLTFPGEPTLVESEAQVDDWVTKLVAKGWTRDATVANNPTLYLKGPSGYSMSITPHVEPKVAPSADLQLSSPCIVTENLQGVRGSDLTAELR